MVNAFKGEVLIEDEDGKKYKFKLGMFGQSELERLVPGEKYTEFLARHKDWGNTEVLTIFRAGLAEYHEDMTKRDVAQLMDRLGGTRCAEIFNEALTKSLPDAPAQEDAKGNARPPMTHTLPERGRKKSRAASATIT